VTRQGRRHVEAEERPRGQLAGDCYLLPKACLFELEHHPDLVGVEEVDVRTAAVGETGQRLMANVVSSRELHYRLEDRMELAGLDQVADLDPEPVALLALDQGRSE
jgi:hypothetical protein